eukprot:scaffold2047_cov129-Cylindrotheca_fusiformis.AAC.35
MSHTTVASYNFGEQHEDDRPTSQAVGTSTCQTTNNSLYQQQRNNGSDRLNKKETMGDRKARLAALAAKAGRTKSIRSDEEEGGTNTEEKQVSLAFRNYAPASSLEEPEEGSAAKRMRMAEEETKTSALQEALQAAKSEIATRHGSGPATGGDSQAPKKINWDLKRDLEKRLAKLERRTQKAIVELLKERLEREANEEANGDDSSDLD